MKKLIPFAAVLMVLLLLLPGRGIAQGDSSPVPVVKSPIYFDISPPLRDIPVIPATEPEPKKPKNPELQYRAYPYAATALPQGPDPVWQQQMGTTGLETDAPLVNFEGNPNCGFPPDCNGEVGPNHYFQAINVSFQIFNKTGTSVYGPAMNKTIWSGLPGAAENGSDPVVLYDQQADRWFYSDITHVTAPFYIRVAVSVTNDPTGSWYRWVYSYGASVPDYPRYGIWRDGYYFACNLGGGQDVGVLQRDLMLAGNPGPVFIHFSNPWRPNSGFHAIMPFDNDGSWATAGTAGQFATINDDAWGGSDQLWLYTLSVNWSSPGAATFTRTQQLNVAAFDANFGASWDNIYQKGVAQRLDAVPQVLMHKAQYRNFGSYQSLVCCHAVDVDATDHAGVRWYELRRAGGLWYLNQQGTYAPDGDSRWMASIAQNQYGDIGMGYSVSSTNTYPSIRFTGRRAGDASGTMTIAEQSIQAGTTSQTGGNRWGDYTAIAVDPSDDKTFWYTNEYIIPGNARRTRVAAFSFGTGCTASGGCDEYISRVQAGTIDNSTGCLNYADYTSTHSANLPVNGIVHVTVTNGTPLYSGDQCGIWVDWNRNGSFYDAGDAITVTGTPGVGPYTATIIPPAGQTLGNCTMRIRITWTGALDPCGSYSFGEVEDYRLSITPKVPNVWTGNFNNYWGNHPNWSLEHVPTADEDVIIPNVNMPCIVDYSPKVCSNLTTYSGSTLLISANTLTVNNDITIYGQLAMDNAAGVLNVMGDIFWDNGSTANITAASMMWIYGYWEFRVGSNVQLANGYVDFAGSTTAFIRTYAPNCSFNNVGVYKNGGALGLSSTSDYDLTINGYFNIQPNCTFGSFSDHALILRGAFYNNHHFSFDYGTLVMDGVNQYIKSNVGDYVNNLTISPTGTTSFDNTYTNTLKVYGNLVIQSGVFNPLNNNVEVAGNWTNSVGTGGFTEGTGKVTFNGGNYHQLCSNETFNTLEVNKPSGGAFRMNGTHVTCANYDWTAGSVDVLSGSFTANDLADNGIAGNFYLNTGGTINLYNLDGWVDLLGFLYIYGGNFNVWGNGVDSYWPYLNNAGVTMSGGTLDFKNVGVYIWDDASHTFMENITNGTIKTTDGFRVERADYTPSGGTLEFYGPADGFFHTTNGGYVNNVVVNKGVVDNSGVFVNPVIRDRETGTVTDAPLANTVLVNNSADIKGDLTIQAGVLSSGNYTIYVGGNWTNTVGTAGFLEGSGIVDFIGSGYSKILTNETFYNLYEEKTNSDFSALELMNGLTVNVLNNLYIYDGSFELDDYATLDVEGDIGMALGAGLNANDAPIITINLAGNWLNYNSDYDIYHGFDPGAYSTVTFNGTIDQTMLTGCPQEDFYNLKINKTAGRFRPSNNTQSYYDVTILDGIWEDNVGGLTHSIWRNFTVISGVAQLNNATYLNTFEFKGNLNSILSCDPTVAGYFHNLLINKSTGYTVTQNSYASCQHGGEFTIEEGTYDMNGNGFSLWGNATINDGGTLSLPAGSDFSITGGFTLGVNSGGHLNILGIAVDPVTIRSNVSTSRYSFNVSSGGTIAADYCTFKNMTTNGVNVQSGATIDPAHAFRRCTFRDGQSGGTLLTINNNQTLTVRNAVFPTNTWSGTNNASKTINQGHVYFVDYSGGFSGESYDNDAFSRLTWVPALLTVPTATPGTICAGGTSQLHAVPSGGLAPYTYLWSPATGLSSTTIENPVANPATTKIYSVTVTDALGTTATNSVTLTVNPVLPVSITIAASANPSPPGSYVTFTATPVNGGSSPAYQWKVNGLNVGVGLSTYSYIPSYGDDVTCVLTSNYTCPSGNPATSNVITMIIVAINTSVTGIIPSPLNLCFDATNTITVAGGGTSFLVQPGGSATMIAGMKIRYLPTSTVLSGGYMHGYITGTNAYCGSLPPAMVAVVTGAPEQPGPSGSSTFSIYPNPATGKFTLVQRGEYSDGAVKVDLFGLRGERLLSQVLINEQKHEFNVSNLPAGMYFVKVTKGERMETFKLILNQ